MEAQLLLYQFNAGQLISEPLLGCSVVCKGLRIVSAGFP